MTCEGPPWLPPVGTSLVSSEINQRLGYAAITSLNLLASIHLTPLNFLLRSLAYPFIMNWSFRNLYGYWSCVASPFIIVSSCMLKCAARIVYVQWDKTPKATVPCVLVLKFPYDWLWTSRTEFCDHQFMFEKGIFTNTQCLCSFIFMIICVYI